MPNTHPKSYGHGFMPSWHRPWLRYIETPDQGGANDSQNDGQDGAQPGENSGNDAQQQNSQNAAQQGAQPGAQQQNQGGSLENASREDLLAEVRRLRGENAAKRTTARDAQQEREQLLQTVAQALGLKEEQVTPEQLQQQLAQAQQEQQRHQQEIRERDVQLAVLRLAPALNANGARLLDSRSFLTKLASVDPQDEAAVKAAITAAVQQDAAFSTAAASSGSSGHQGSGARPTPKTLAAAISSHYGGN